jgi:hypothetical protein
MSRRFNRAVSGAQAELLPKDSQQLLVAACEHEQLLVVILGAGRFCAIGLVICRECLIVFCRLADINNRKVIA